MILLVFSELRFAILAGSNTWMPGANPVLPSIFKGGKRLRKLQSLEKILIRRNGFKSKPTDHNLRNGTCN
jgi:hypothetical protein